MQPIRSFMRLEFPLLKTELSFKMMFISPFEKETKLMELQKRFNKFESRMVHRYVK